MTRVDPSGLAWVPYQVQVPYLYKEWHTIYYKVPVIAINWYLGFIPIPYISGWRTESFSYWIPRVGHRTETRYRWVEPPSRFVSFVSGVKKSLGYQPSKPAGCRKISYGPQTNGRGGAWGDLYDHYWGDTGKTSSLENLGYDLASMTHPYVAAATLAPSLLNTRRDYSNGNIDRNRALFNVAMDVVSTPYTSGASAFANAMDYADEKGWLDPINDFMSR